MDRTTAEDILYREAALLDDGRFEEWLELFCDDGLYWVPGDDPDGDPRRTVSIVYDDASRRRARVDRWVHRSNWRDDPPGRLVHFVSNVVVLETGDGHAVVASNQLVTHARRGQEISVTARCTHDLRLVDGRWLIALKKVCLLAADRYLPPGAIVIL